MFTPEGVPMAPQEWLQFYEDAYFLDRPGIVKRLNRSSCFIEKLACNLLNANTPLTFDDFKFIMGWKIGVISHRKSENCHRVVYWPSWDSKLRRYRARYRCSLNWLVQNQHQIQQAAAHDPQSAFGLLEQAKRGRDLIGFGTTYMLTVLFFLTHGRCPIYDQFAHKAAQAIATNTPPCKAVYVQPVTNWSEYQAYQALLAPVVATCGLSMPVPRFVDRALWVYGHLFGKNRAC